MDEAVRQRLRVDVTGAVQGVGFRPFVHRLACSENLGGFVRNTGAGVSLEVEGEADALARFLARLDTDIGPPAKIRARSVRRITVRGECGFAIVPSVADGACDVTVLPDLATCAECAREIFDPADRRFRYPFTSCVRCGPRYSIIAAVPYDRERTAMRGFAMCAACRAEYDDPASRRFHAEINACPRCGPQLALLDASGAMLAGRNDALLLTAAGLRAGLIVAVKGLGGFQLLADARNEAVVQRLRQRKRRPGKPFAIMVPTLAHAESLADISDAERDVLQSPAAPIVLLRARPGTLALGIAPGLSRLGVMLPTTPLHDLLLHDLGIPVIATSGNAGDEPIVTDEDEALGRLGGIADQFLVHDRPILRPVDDSVVRVIGGRPAVLRCARGYAPLSLAASSPSPPTLAFGGHQKAAVAIGGCGRIVLGPHIGDLDGVATRAAFARSAIALPALHGLTPVLHACDTHPDYQSAQLAEQGGQPLRRVPHHLAHALAGMIDNGLAAPVLAVTWDGTGDGGDGTIWGGEFLAITGASWRRVAHLRPFRLPGGEAAAREPRRSALGALHGALGDALFTLTDLPPVVSFAPAERRLLQAVLARGINAPLTSSAGRLFDAVASILDLCQRASFEGEAAMRLEAAAERAGTPLAPACVAGDAGGLVIDWRPTLRAIVAARDDAGVASGFHDALADAIVAVARHVGIARVLLTGGCFQNAVLTERTVERLHRAGFQARWHHRVPPNDGGLAVGQVAFAARPLVQEMP